MRSCAVKNCVCVSYVHMLNSISVAKVGVNRKINLKNLFRHLEHFCFVALDLGKHNKRQTCYLVSCFFQGVQV